MLLNRGGFEVELLWQTRIFSVTNLIKVVIELFRVSLDLGGITPNALVGIVLMVMAVFPCSSPVSLGATWVARSLKQACLGPDNFKSF